MPNTIQVAHILQESYVDGPGLRQVLYLQGCPLGCPGCQSPQLHPFEGGTAWLIDDLAAHILDNDLPLTISGGEPMAQSSAVAELIMAIRLQRPDWHIIVYSGLALDDILWLLVEIPAILPDALFILHNADVLVDGPFVQDLDHDRVQYRGSSNQRPIDLRKTIIGPDLRIIRLETLDWTTRQVLTITTDGQIVGTAGQMRRLFGPQNPHLQHTRMCGQLEPEPDNTS